MRHLIVSREYPPAAYPPGGIGTYVRNIARLLAEAGETVHVIAQQWTGAPDPLVAEVDGRLLVHRVPIDRPLVDGGDHAILTGMAATGFPEQAFAWHAALLGERLAEEESIDLIEGQDWEAPLYYLQLRRALRLGPSHRPPCFVHLHSPTELIFEANHWDLDRSDYVPTKRLEDYSITAADALLCPSRYLARQAEALYQLPTGSVAVIPLPRGDSAHLERAPEVWRTGTILYLGRIEPRKGVLEWVEAALSVARHRSDLEFDFVGGDAPCPGDGSRSCREYLLGCIPDRLRPRFRFHGVQPRAELPGFLSRARLAVVPSRWENFPNTCIEAMSSGLPVLVSPTGGMAEMVEDGVTGWIADSGEPADLAAALRRALATPPEELATMGATARVAVGRLCDNDETVRRHLEFRRRVASGGVIKSAALAPDLPRSAGASERDLLRATGGADPAEATGIGIIIDLVHSDAIAARVLASVRDQTEAPRVVVVVGSTDGPSEGLDRARAAGWDVLVIDAPRSSARWNAALRRLSRLAPPPLGVALLTTAVSLHPDYVARMARILEQRRDTGIVSPWTAIDGGTSAVVAPCPAFPYQWAWNDVGPGAVFRIGPLRSAAPVRSDLDHGFELWDLANAVLAAGWRAVTYPAVLVDRIAEDADRVIPVIPVGGYQMRNRLLCRTADLLGASAVDVALLAPGRAPPRAAPMEPTNPIGPEPPQPHLPEVAPAAPRDPRPRPEFQPAGLPEAWVPDAPVAGLEPDAVRRLPFGRKAALLLRAIRNPRHAASWLAWYRRRSASPGRRNGDSP